MKQCSRNECKNGGTCVTVSDIHYTCECKAGYTGRNCETDIGETSVTLLCPVVDSSQVGAHLNAHAVMNG